MGSGISEKKEDDVRKSTAQDGTVPHDAERDGTVRHDAAQVRTMRNSAEDLHTITVREALKLFEDAGVPRAERTLVKWCGKDATGTGRLDCELDSNEGRYYITEESIDRAIAEEQAKGQGRTPKVEMGEGKPNVEERDSEETRLKLRDLEISNRAKDQYIEKLEDNQKGLIEQLTGASHEIGVLETKLLALEAPKGEVEEKPSVVEAGGSKQTDSA